MRYLALFVVIISVANASTVGRSAELEVPFVEEGPMENLDLTMTQNSRFMDFQNMPLKSQGGYLKMSTSKGFCDNLCGGRMTTEYRKEMTELMHQRRMMLLLDNMEQMIQKSGFGVMEQGKIMASNKMATELLQLTNQAEEAQIHQILKDIQETFYRDLPYKSDSKVIERKALLEVELQLRQIMKQIKDDVVMKPETDLKRHMEHLIQAIIRSRMTMQDLQQFVKVPFMTGFFRNSIRQLIQEDKILRTEAILSERQILRQQIQLRLQFLQQQVQQMKVFKIMMAQRKELVPSQKVHAMQQAEEEIFQEQEDLLIKLLTHQTIISHLQEVLSVQQKTMQDILVQRAQMEMNQSDTDVDSMMMMMSERMRA